MFPQVWGSTALGFSDIGGQAMTSAYTVIVEDSYSGYYGVFFNTRLAYMIKNPNQKFFEDMQNYRMRSVSESGLYRRAE